MAYTEACLSLELQTLPRFRPVSLSLSMDNTWAAHWRGPPDLFWLSSYIASHCLSVAPQSGAKYQFYCLMQYFKLKL